MSDGAIGVISVTVILSLLALHPVFLTWRGRQLRRRKLICALLIQAGKDIDPAKWHRELSFHEENEHIRRSDKYSAPNQLDYDITEKGASWIRWEK